MSTRRWRLVRTTAITVLLAAGIAACGQATSPPSATTSPSSSPSTTRPTPATTPSQGPSPAPSHPTAPRASAADQLAGFFAAAETADTRIRHAAALVNQGTGKKSMDFSPAALAAVGALSTTEAARAIPAGLPTELLRRTLLVYSDLESRTLSLIRVGMYRSEYPLALDSQDGKYLYGCLGNGGKAAARFGADLAGLRAAALAAPPVTLAAPDSRAAAELALRVEDINKRNSGCMECGGWIATSLSQIVWQPENDPDIGHSDGYINGIRFRVTYHPGRGWEALMWAC